MKVATFTVRGTMDQSIRWKRAADAEGYASAGSWLAAAADRHLKEQVRAGRPLPLAWLLGRFRVLLIDEREIEVRGLISPPFGYFSGDASGPHRNHPRTLVHLPSKKIIGTLRSASQCRLLASEMAPMLIRDEAGAFRLAQRRQAESV